MDTGGLAQMSYNSFPSSNGLGVPGSGFASRGKGMNIKRLSFDTQAASLPQDNGAPTPRTSRSHLLAGLRTAPKSATSATFPTSAPANQFKHHGSFENGSGLYSDNKNGISLGGAKTSTASSFSSIQTGYYGIGGDESQQMYSLPEEILAPPEIHIDEHGQDQMDPNLYNQLVATNAYLAEQQQRLQQQLINVQAAAQQFKNMNLGGNVSQNFMQQQVATPPFTPNMYQQQQVQNMQPIVTPVMGYPGHYLVYNPLTGQQQLYVDPNAQNQYAETQQNAYYDSPPQQYGTPRLQVSPPPTNVLPAFNRSISPPKKTNSPPHDVSPLPPPSANAFRRGHKKDVSSLVLNDIPRSSPAKSAAFPTTPVGGTFGPGQNRAGEHPVRQPRGPPPLDELLAKPTTKFEGSKNFATRTRRSAVHNLVRAGLERRRTPGSASVGSMTPVSENGEITFSISSDNDSDSGRSGGSGSLSGRPTSVSPRNSTHGAIGSNRPSSHQKQRQRSSERMSVDSNYTTASVGSDDEITVGGTFAAVFKNGGKKVEKKESEPRKAPMLILTSASEKRKSSVY